MSLDRRSTLSLCLGSFFIMAGAAFVAWSRWDGLSHEQPSIKESALPEAFNPALNARTGTGWPAATPAEKTPETPPATATPTAAPGTPASPPPPAALPSPATKRNIRFTYPNSKPLKVEIVGSFNNWTPAPMTKGENHLWETTVSLAPGEYTYNFIVNGKVVRDPNNPRTAPEGRSLLLVKPLNK